MKSQLKLFSVFFIAFVLGMSVNNIAYSGITPSSPFKIAIVDVAKVIESSSSVSELKKEQKTKVKDLMAFVSNARADVAKQKDEKSKKALEEKYNKELIVRKTAIEKNYTAKLHEINADITAKIANIAKTKKYNVVLAKSTVLYGGRDITPEVIKVIK
jgi:outer membrane protein